MRFVRVPEVALEISEQVGEDLEVNTRRQDREIGERMRELEIEKAILPIPEVGNTTGFRKCIEHVFHKSGRELL